MPQRWLARHGREEDALITIAWYRKRPVEWTFCQDELTEMLVCVKEEYEGKSLWRQCIAPGNWQRFVIGFRYGESVQSRIFEVADCRVPQHVHSSTILWTGKYQRLHINNLQTNIFPSSAIL